MAIPKLLTASNEEHYGLSYTKKEYRGYIQDPYNNDIMGRNSGPRLMFNLAKTNNKGAFQGIPLIAQLFTIYFDGILRDYDNALPDTIKQTQQETYGRNEF